MTAPSSVRLDIGLDIDNVIYPWSTVFTRWAERSRGLPPGSLEDIADNWSWYKTNWGWTTDEMLATFADGVHAGVIFTEGDPTPGSLACARRLADRGHRLHFVTAREIPGVSHDLAYTRTLDWLERHGFPLASLTVTDSKSAVNSQVFLDDAPHNIEELVEAGHPQPVLWDRPHNRKYVCPVGVKRTRSWQQFERIVEQAAAERSGKSERSLLFR